MKFSWSKKKANSNLQKHGVSFEEAKSVFLDDLALLLDDPDHSADEERFILLGYSSQARIIIVCHCYRNNEEEMRLISARKATKIESNSYRKRK